jgi:hypothetical protein
MHQVKEVHIGVSRLINTGNYENIRIDAECTVTVDKGMSPEDAWDLAYNQAVNNCKKRTPMVMGKLVRETNEPEPQHMGTRKRKAKRSGKGLSRLAGDTEY